MSGEVITAGPLIRGVCQLAPKASSEPRTHTVIPSVGTHKIPDETQMNGFLSSSSPTLLESCLLVFLFPMVFFVRSKEFTTPAGARAACVRGLVLFSLRLASMRKAQLRVAPASGGRRDRGTVPRRPHDVFLTARTAWPHVPLLCPEQHRPQVINNNSSSSKGLSRCESSQIALRSLTSTNQWPGRERERGPHGASGE